MARVDDDEFLFVTESETESSEVQVGSEVPGAEETRAVMDIGECSV